jgi:hypothetical protein
MNNTKGGRGRQVPYTSTHVRIPDPIKHLVLVLTGYYRNTLTVPTLASLSPLDSEYIQEYQSPQQSLDTDLATIQQQAETIRAYLSEINYLKQKLSKEETLPSLDDAIGLSQELIKRKKSARASMGLLIQGLYKVDIVGDSMTSALWLTKFKPNG